MKLIFQITAGTIFGYVGVTVLNIFLTAFVYWMAR